MFNFNGLKKQGPLPEIHALNTKEDRSTTPHVINNTVTTWGKSAGETRSIYRNSKGITRSLHSVSGLDEYYWTNSVLFSWWMCFICQVQLTVPRGSFNNTYGCSEGIFTIFKEPDNCLDEKIISLLHDEKRFLNEAPKLHLFFLIQIKMVARNYISLHNL